MPLFSYSNCKGCGCKPCIWEDFSGYDLCDSLIDCNMQSVCNAMDTFCSKEEFVKEVNTKVVITQARLWELWKEFFGQLISVSDMKWWSDYVNFGEYILSKTPCCIRYRIENYIPFLQLYECNKMAVKKLGYEDRGSGNFTFKFVFVDSRFFFPTASKSYFNIFVLLPIVILTYIYWLCYCS